MTGRSRGAAGGMSPDAATSLDRRRVLRLLLTTGSAVVLAACSSRAAANPPTSGPGTLNIVAHQDDDLLFLSPDLIHLVQSGRRVRTVYITAGDAGAGEAYWHSRESGSRAAYAEMAGAANAWVQSDAGIDGSPITVFTLKARPTISLAFMRLPDGNGDGTGFPVNHNESLEKLWTGQITATRTVDGAASYTKAGLQDTLTALMSSFQPDHINAQDYSGTYGDGDHSDHHTAAYLARAAQARYARAHDFTGYQDYHINQRPANLAAADSAAKERAFFTYAQHDVLVCGSTAQCAGTWGYPDWFHREYEVGQPTS